VLAISRSQSRVALLATSLVLWTAREAIGVVVVLDPGHGGDDKGAVGGPCFESVLNLIVSKETVFEAEWARWNPTPVTFRLTRTGDYDVPYYTRATYGDPIGADAFISVHHNDGNWLTGYPLYEDCLPPACQHQTHPCVQGPYTTHSLYLANAWTSKFAQVLGYNSEVRARRLYYSTAAPRLSHVENPQRFRCGADVLIYSARPAVIGEAYGMTSSMASPGCSQFSYPLNPVIPDEAWSYVQTAADFFNTTSIGTSFQAQGGTTAVTLTWTESDTRRSVYYDLYRSDTCYGAFSLLNSVYSGDPNYTSDREHYTYIDNTVQYSRMYYYRIVVTTEMVDASAAPTALPAATPPGAPANLSATLSGSSVSLSWSASSGTVSGYRIFRSRYHSITSCTDIYELIDTVTMTSTQDLTAPQGIPLRYRVQAFNSTGASELSNETGIAVTTDVRFGDPGRLRNNSLALSVLSNGSGFQFTVPSLTRVTIAVYDALGRHVATPYSETAFGGVHVVDWNRRSARGKLVSGVYFARLQTADGSEVSAKFIMIH